MQPVRTFGLAVIMVATVAPFAAKAEPDQKNIRGYVVGKGGVARVTNEPQADSSESISTEQTSNRGYVVGSSGVARRAKQPQTGSVNSGNTAHKSSQGTDFGARVNASSRQAGNTGGPGTPPPAESQAKSKPKGLQDETRSALSVIR